MKGSGVNAGKHFPKQSALNHLMNSVLFHYCHSEIFELYQRIVYASLC
jgi:hypothetical protein